MLKATEGFDPQLITLLAAARLTVPLDEALPTTGLQVEADGVLLPATREVWRAWTGHRAVWGQPWHGPVYTMGSSEDTPPWTGPRACLCATCQEHVSSDSKNN